MQGYHRPYTESFGVSNNFLLSLFRGQGLGRFMPRVQHLVLESHCHFVFNIDRLNARWTVALAGDCRFKGVAAFSVAGTPTVLLGRKRVP